MKRKAVAQEVYPAPPEFDLFGMLIAYESGDMNGEEMLAMFSLLVRTGIAWALQGEYGRRARDLILSGHLDTRGNILKSLDDED